MLTESTTPLPAAAPGLVLGFVVVSAFTTTWFRPLHPGARHAYAVHALIGLLGAGWGWLLLPAQVGESAPLWALGMVLGCVYCLGAFVALASPANGSPTRWLVTILATGGAAALLAHGSLIAGVLLALGAAGFALLTQSDAPSPGSPDDPALVARNAAMGYVVLNLGLAAALMPPFLGALVLPLLGAFDGFGEDAGFDSEGPAVGAIAVALVVRTIVAFAAAALAAGLAALLARRLPAGARPMLAVAALLMACPYAVAAPFQATPVALLLLAAGVLMVSAGAAVAGVALGNGHPIKSALCAACAGHLAALNLALPALEALAFGWAFLAALLEGLAAVPITVAAYWWGYGRPTAGAESPSVPTPPPPAGGGRLAPPERVWSAKGPTSTPPRSEG